MSYDTIVPPEAVSQKAKVAILAIQKANQSTEHADRNMTIAESVALFKTDGYISTGFTRYDVQIGAYIPVLCLLVGVEHALMPS